MGWLKDVYDLAKSEGWIEGLKSIFIRPPRILVLGSTGSGKSEFLKTVRSTELRVSIPPEIRTEIDTKQRIEVLGNAIDFVDTPGDYDFATSRISAVDAAIRNSYDGIINVVSFGYHEYVYEGNETNLALTPENSPNNDWIATHLNRETKMLAEWIELVRFAQKQPFLMTVCNKADLWWNSRNECRTHYSKSEYGKMISESGLTKYSIHNFCAIRRPFFGKYSNPESLSIDLEINIRDLYLKELLSRLGRNIQNGKSF